jgi:hypothetical protein
MKSLLFLITLIFTIIASAQKEENRFLLIREINGQKQGWISLSYTDRGKEY